MAPADGPKDAGESEAGSSLNVVTSSGVATNLSWWTALSRADNEVRLTRSCGDDDCSIPDDFLVVADLRSPSEAEALYETLKARINLKAQMFDASNSPSLPSKGKPL